MSATLNDGIWVLAELGTLLVMLFYCYKRTNGDIASPSVMTLLFFTVSFLCYSYNLGKWAVVFTYKAYFLYTISFTLMILIEVYWINRTRRAREKLRNVDCKIEIKRPAEKYLFCIFFIFSFIYLYRVYKSGMSLGATSLLATIGYNKEEGEYDGIARLMYNLVRLASYVYITIVAQNIICKNESIKQNWKSVLIVIITTILTFFSGQRSSMICYILSVVVAIYIASYGLKTKDRILFKSRFKRVLMIGSIIIISIFFLTANLVKATDKERIFVDYITYYFGGTNALMGEIVENPSLGHTKFRGYFGEKTFNGFWKALYENKIVSKEPSEIEWIRADGEITIAGNEYSFFCGPYVDFGFIGTLIFVSFFYSTFSFLYYHKILSNKISIQRTYISALFLFLYAMISMSFYQDTIRTYVRPINLLYLVYMYFFCRFFLIIRRDKKNESSNISSRIG